MASDYKVGAAHYCGCCTHAASRHFRKTINDMRVPCAGAQHVPNDECDCMRTRLEIMAGAETSGKAYKPEEIKRRRTSAGEK